jgi:hypothetical protein
MERRPDAIGASRRQGDAYGRFADVGGRRTRRPPSKRRSVKIADPRLQGRRCGRPAIRQLGALFRIIGSYRRWTDPARPRSAWGPGGARGLDFATFGQFDAVRLRLCQVDHAVGTRPHCAGTGSPHLDIEDIESPRHSKRKLAVEVLKGLRLRVGHRVYGVFTLGAMHFFSPSAAALGHK